PSEVVRMIGSITGAKTFMNPKEELGEVNMCRALEAYVAEKMEEAAKAAAEEATKEAVKETELRMSKEIEAYVAERMEEAEKRGISIINSMRAANASSDQIIEHLIEQMSIPKERNI
ncbi:MAG: hypothetical protein R3Y40_08425, partial [Eubacteriales bacterium]